MFRRLRNMLRMSWPKIRVCALSSLTTSVMDRLREAPDSIRDAYATCGDELAAALGPGFDHLTVEEREFAFCTVVSHSLAPFGGSTCQTFPELARQTTLNCGNYGLLAYHLARTLIASF